MSKTLRPNRGRTPEDYEVLKHQAAVLYIRHGKSHKAIADELDISIQSLSAWNKAGRWTELRPDMEVINQYKAAGYYVDKGMKESEISQKLGISEVTIKMWIYLYGWDAARQIRHAEDINVEIIGTFCQHFKTMFPALRVEIDLAKDDYFKSIAPKI